MSQQSLARTLWLLATMFLAAFIEEARAQPRNTEEGALWTLARKACTGTLTKRQDIAESTELDNPMRLFAVRPILDNVGIASRDCPEQSRTFKTSTIHILLGHYADGTGYYYKISTRSEELLGVGLCPYEQKCRAIAPVRIDGGRRIFADDLQKDFKALLQRVIENWGG